MAFSLSAEAPMPSSLTAVSEVFRPLGSVLSLLPEPAWHQRFLPSYRYRRHRRPVHLSPGVSAEASSILVGIPSALGLQYSPCSEVLIRIFGLGVVESLQHWLLSPASVGAGLSLRPPELSLGLGY